MYSIFKKVCLLLNDFFESEQTVVGILRDYAPQKHAYFGFQTPDLLNLTVAVNFSTKTINRQPWE